MSDHILKLREEFFTDVKEGGKTAELRLNDRDYKVGDWLYLEEVDSDLKHTGDTVAACVTHVADVGFLLPGYVLLSIKVY